MTSHCDSHDYILNIGQMRNYKYVGQFYIEPVPYNRENSILQGAVSEFEAQRRGSGGKQASKRGGQNEDRTGIATRLVSGTSRGTAEKRKRMRVQQ